MDDLKKWIQIRKDLYRQIQSEVRQRLGEDTPELMQYHKSYEKEFLKAWTDSNAKELFAGIAASDIVLMGDFHALNQSQKAQMRIIRQIPKSRHLILAVEFFEAQHQKEIDLFLAGKLSEKDFLLKIEWKERWGFAWETYRPLIKWAQKNKVPVYGLNKYYTRRSMRTLNSRDEFSGRLLRRLHRENTSSLIFAIYGDLHLAEKHIPAAIRHGKGTQPKILRIFQNVERLYFKLLENGLEHSADLVRLSDGSFCLQSVPPWVKWQNYLIYLERTYDLELEEECGGGVEETEFIPIDYTDHVSRYVKLISDELGLPQIADSLSVYTADNASFWVQVNEVYSKKCIRWIEILIAQEVSFYLPEIESAYLARPTVNHAASLALRFLHAKVSGQKRLLLPDGESFLALIWLETVGYFGSKLINHKRKADTIIDIKASLASKAPHDAGKEALQLALSQKMHELMVITAAKPEVLLRRVPRKKESYISAAKLLGGMLGERLFGGYRKGLLSRLTWSAFLRKNIEQEGFLAVYYDIVEVAESLPIPFQSKREKL